LLFDASLIGTTPFEILLSDFHHFFFVFARVLGLVIGMPFLSQIEVSGRFRAVACVALTMAFAPLVSGDYFPASSTLTVAFCRFLGEFLIGFLIGLIARFALAAVELAGHIISFATGLSSAMVVNPSYSSQGSLVGVFLTMSAITSFLVLDGHHMLFENLLASYSRLTPDWFSLDSPLIKDMFKGIVILSDTLMRVGFQMSVPFLLVNTVLQFALGVLGKLVPQVQIFFLGISLQILLGWFVLLVSMGAILFVYEKLNTSTYSIMGFAHG
jgi:flagellar biosynthetic protein FliR